MSGEEVILDVESTPALAGISGTLARAEHESQVSTAKKYPRSITTFQRDIETMACVTEAVAASCIYSLPRRDGNEIKRIEGPSVRMAEMVASAWGNCRVAARQVDEGDDFVAAQGVFMDVERNVAVSVEVRRRITDRNGRRYSADMVNVTANAAVSVALRNAVLRGVPRALWEQAYAKARHVVAGDAKTLSTRRLEALEFMSKLGVERERVLAGLGVKGVEDITVDHLVTLKATASAIRSGEQSIEDAFPLEEVAKEKPEVKGGVAGVKEALARESSSREAPTTPPPDAPASPVAVPASPTPAGRPPEVTGNSGISGESGTATDVLPMCSRCTQEAVKNIGGAWFCAVHLPAEKKKAKP